MAKRGKKSLDEVAGERPAGGRESGLQRFRREVGAETHRLGVQGAAELGSALFQGSSYVPYGSGQAVDLTDGRAEKKSLDEVAAEPARAPQRQQEMDRQR